MVIISPHFPKLQEKNDLELVEVGQATLFVKETTQTPNSEALA